MSAHAPWTDVDLAGSGKQVGHVHVPLEQAWRGSEVLDLPFCQISNGSGPTVLLVGGNHGDEYEGPIVLGRLVRELDAGAVNGRVWILPALNLPAVLAQTRESPIDALNLNRVWPGRADGSVTERIVHFVDSELLPGADVFSDLHTGGDGFDLVPMSLSHHSDDVERAASIRAAARAFGAPLNVELRLGPERLTASSRAHDSGLLVVGAETGGGTTVGPVSLAVCERGVRNLLAHVGVLDEPAWPDTAAPATRFTRKWGLTAEVAVPRDGVFVPLHDLWDEVEAGAPAGYLYALESPQDAPEVLRWPASGLVAGRSARSGVREGAVIYWLVEDV